MALGHYLQGSLGQELHKGLGSHLQTAIASGCIALTVKDLSEICDFVSVCIRVCIRDHKDLCGFKRISNQGLTSDEL